MTAQNLVLLIECSGDCGIPMRECSHLLIIIPSKEQLGQHANNWGVRILHGINFQKGSYGGQCQAATTVTSPDFC